MHKWQKSYVSDTSHHVNAFGKVKKWGHLPVSGSCSRSGLTNSVREGIPRDCSATRVHVNTCVIYFSNAGKTFQRGEEKSQSFLNEVLNLLKSIFSLISCVGACLVLQVMWRSESCHSTVKLTALTHASSPLMWMRRGCRWPVSLRR